MKRVSINLRKVIAGIAVCAICTSVGGNVSMVAAHASQGKKNGNSTVIKGKEKKNNGKHQNNGNHSEKAWNQKMIQAEGIAEEGKEVKIAIIDSGVNFSTDINVVERMNFIEDDECSILYEDFSGHGTAVAGIIGALDNEEGITGINPNVRIYSARVLDNNLQAPVERIIAAIEWAMARDVDIINMSLGLHTDVPALHQAVQEAYAQGILLVASVGNDGSITYPAAYEEVIAVSSVDSCGMSVQGETVSMIIELMAPGENILSSAIFDGVIGGSGTSLATAHVTGVASVLMELNPDMPAEFIRALMDYSANLYGNKEVYGNGVVDLEYAIDITPSFKKAYEKYLRKSSQNEVQRKKQQEKFWGEIIKKVPQNEKDVEVFENLENVVGLWFMDGHQELFENAYNQVSYTFLDDELYVIIAGCRYPDKNNNLKGMNANPYHGFVWRDHDPRNGAYGVDSNYLSNYIALTKIALNSGSMTGLTKPTGMTNEDWARMTADFANGKVGNESYSVALRNALEDAFDNNISSEALETLLANIDMSNNTSTGLKNRKLFIYGMAMHLAADVYAHSAWKKDVTDARAKRLKHTGCDTTAVYAKRFDAAQAVLKNILYRAYYLYQGSLMDFSIATNYYGTVPSDRFYLYNFVEYARAESPASYQIWTQYHDNNFVSYNYADLLSNIEVDACNLERCPEDLAN